MIATPTSAPARKGYDTQRALWGFALLLAVYLVVVYGVPKPDAIKPAGWRLLGIFLATIVGSVVEPIPAGALGLIAITLSAAFGILPLDQALGGFAVPPGGVGRGRGFSFLGW